MLSSTAVTFSGVVRFVFAGSSGRDCLSRNPSFSSLIIEKASMTMECSVWREE
jgi:hypothetical protein